MPELISEKTVVARKPHRCQCCETVCIRPGDTYNREVLVHDRRVYTWVSCSDCDALMPTVYEWSCGDDEGVGADTFQEWAHDNRDDPRAQAYLERRAVAWRGARSPG